MSFQNLLDRKKRESRAFSIMDTDSSLAGGLLGARANMSSSDDPDDPMYAGKLCVNPWLVTSQDLTVKSKLDDPFLIFI